MMYKRTRRNWTQRKAYRRSGGIRRGRRLQQNGAIVPARARNVALAGVMARYGPAALRAGYNVARDMYRERRMQNQARRAQKLSSKRTGRISTMSTRTGRGSVEKQYVTKRFGQKKSLMTKIVRLNTPLLTMAAGGIRNQDSTTGTAIPGIYRMSNTLGDAVATSGLAPVFILSCNSTVQNNVFADPIRVARVVNTGRVMWDIVNNALDEAAGGFRWALEQSITGAEPTGECGRIINQWMALRCVLYGCKTQSTKWTIEYVQCAMDFAAPEEEDALFTATGTHADRYRDMVYGYWQNRIRPLVSSEIALRMNPQRLGNAPLFKVLQKHSYTVAPHQTIESDESPNCIIAKMFYNDGRLLNYQWDGPTSVYDAARTGVANGADDLIVQPEQQFVPSRTGAATGDGVVPVVQPHPLARRYIIITCSNTTNTATASETADNTPSFDFVLRKREVRGPNYAV